MSDIRNLLCLSAIPQLGPTRIRSLLTHFNTPEEILAASPKDLVRVPGITQSIARTIVTHTGGMDFADRQLRLAERAHSRIVSLLDDEYPELLKKIYDPPPYLYVLGRFEPADRFSIGIVGTRLPSAYGIRVAEVFASRLCALGITIVSGLARGIDTNAHSAALTAGGRTIAVVGSGLDIPYPPENKELMTRIAESGAVVSEFPMGTKPDAPHFPRRNRIISGLSLGTLIVESAKDGGAMITATTSLDQNREVFAIPGSVFEARSSGSNKLIQEGQAKLVTEVGDIVDELRVKLKPILKQSNRPEPPLPTFTLFEQRVFMVLGETPIHIDALSDAAQLATSDTLVSLLSLEFKGLVRQMPGKMFMRM